MLNGTIYTRPNEARAIRERAAEFASRGPSAEHRNNGEEEEYRSADGLSYIANFTKGLPHNMLGEVQQLPYRALLRAMISKDPEDFEEISLGMSGGRRLVNPQAGLAFDLEGPDGQSLTMPPAPRIDEPENSAEMGELYWMALLRDVAFSDYSTDPQVAQAATSLSEEFSDFRGPKDQVSGNVTPETLFRGLTSGDLVGPYISQFLIKPISYGTLFFEQLVRTAPAGVDYLTNFLEDWLPVQNGRNVPPGPITAPPATHYMRNLRDLATYVHFDALYEAYLNACLILLDMRAPFDPGNPYIDTANEEGFGTFGPPHILSLVTEVATRALKAVWYQKWGVHRRLRPEEFGGRIHVHLDESPGRYPMIDSEILDSSVLAEIQRRFGTYLLPQAFAEGAPTHPAYGAGHATVAGACVTILKAWFDESYMIPNPQIPDPATNFTTLTDAPGSPSLTVGDELNKLAANISLGRNAAGVHWRTDYTESIKLGEAIAIGILREQQLTYNEFSYFTFTKFDGTTITI